MSENPNHEESAVRLFRYDVSIRGLVVVLLVSTVSAMSLLGMEVKEPLYTLVSGAVGWYFGQKGKQ